MKFTDLFVQRPVLSLVTSLLILIAGLQAIGSLSVRQYPRSDNAAVTITTVYTGASADLVRGFITTPLSAPLPLPTVSITCNRRVRWANR